MELQKKIVKRGGDGVVNKRGVERGLLRKRGYSGWRREEKRTFVNYFPSEDGWLSPVVVFSACYLANFFTTFGH